MKKEKKNQRISKVGNSVWQCGFSIRKMAFFCIIFLIFIGRFVLGFFLISELFVENETSLNQVSLDLDTEQAIPGKARCEFSVRQWESFFAINRS